MSKTPLAQTSHKTEAQQTYRFEFGSDSAIHSISFEGLFRRAELRRMLETARKTSYEKCGRVIRSYLDAHNLNYSGFSVHEEMPKGRIPINFADRLLRSSSCSVIDHYIGNAAVYYGIMDYQYETERCCEGCYYAVARMPSARNGLPEYHVIGQTFSHDVSGENEHSHFAIRKSSNGQQLVTLDEEDGCPILAAFGCVDIMGLLINITDISTKQQVVGLANI